MGVKLLAEKRAEDRQPVTGFLPGLWVACPSGRQISGHLVDLTSRGLGIRVADQLLPDTVLVWQVGDQKVGFDVKWGLFEPGESLSYRYGLELQTDYDLIALLEEARS